MLNCKRCKTPYATQRFIDRTFERLSEKIDPIVKETVLNDYNKIKWYCPDCRRAQQCEL